MWQAGLGINSRMYQQGNKEALFKHSYAFDIILIVVHISKCGMICMISTEKYYIFEKEIKKFKCLVCGFRA